MKLFKKEFRRQCENAYRQYSIFGGRSRETAEVGTRKRSRTGGWGLGSMLGRGGARAR